LSAREGVANEFDHDFEFSLCAAAPRSRSEDYLRWISSFRVIPRAPVPPIMARCATRAALASNPGPGATDTPSPGGRY